MAVVIGGSSGLGKAAGKALIAKGVRVTAAARGAVARAPHSAREREVSGALSPAHHRYEARSRRGALTCQHGAGTPTGEITMGQFVYLYRIAESDRREATASPEQAQAILQKWMAWMKELGEQGHLNDRGHPLEPTGKVISGQQKRVTDGPFAETKDLVGGYTLIEARDLAQAAELSRGCPILELGGAVEVRPVREINM
jgi:hypothetical protein